MKSAFYIIARQILFLLLAGISFSCIREGIDSCDPIDPDPNPEPYELRFYYTYPPKNGVAGVGFDPNEVEIMQLFVFDENNLFVDSFIDYHPDVADKNYYTTISLEPGKYQVIAYGNLTESYRIAPDKLEPGITRLEDIIYYYTDQVDRTITQHPKHLFHASLRDIVVTKSINDYTLHLRRNTYVLNITAEGLPAAPDSYQWVITDSNWKYEFDNSYLSCEETDYIQDIHFGTFKGQYTTQFTTLRLDRDRIPFLKLYDKKSGKILYQDQLIPLILKLEERGTKVDFSIMYEFDIHLLFETDPLTGSLVVEIYINGWSVCEKEVIIDLA